MTSPFANTRLLVVGAHTTATQFLLRRLPETGEYLVADGYRVAADGGRGSNQAVAAARIGARVTLVSSRDRVLPGEDADAAQVIEDVFRRRGMTVLDRSRAESVKRTGDGVVVQLQDGRTVEFTSGVYRSTKPTAADKIDVLYDPKDPRHAKVNDTAGRLLGPVITGGIGAVFLLVGLVLLFAHRRVRSRA